MDGGPIRLSKYLSQNNICSRREAEYFIERGWLKVDGRIIREQGTRVTESSTVVLDQRAIDHQSRFVTVLMNKPIGFVSGKAEAGRKPAASLIRKSNHFGHAREASSIGWPLTGLAPAGRLDSDSTGLLVLTQDGRIAKQLISANSGVEKEYMVRTDLPLSDTQVDQLKFGLSLDGVTLKPAKVIPIDSNYFRVVLKEGRNRQIRRMCELIGLRAIALKRVRIGRIVLGSLPVGKWRLMRSDERF